VTLDEFFASARNAAGEDPKNVSPRVLSSLLDQYLEEILLDRAVAAARPPAPARSPRERRRAYLTRRAGLETLTDADLRKEFDAHPDRYKSARVRARLAAPLPDARGRRRRGEDASKEGADWGSRCRAPRASRRTRRPAARSAFSAASDLPREFEKAIWGLPAGGTSGVLPAPHGFHVFRVEERLDARDITFEEARPASASRSPRSSARKPSRTRSPRRAVSLPRRHPRGPPPVPVCRHESEGPESRSLRGPGPDFARLRPCDDISATFQTAPRGGRRNGCPRRPHSGKPARGQRGRQPDPDPRELADHHAEPVRRPDRAEHPRERAPPGAAQREEFKKSVMEELVNEALLEDRAKELDLITSRRRRSRTRSSGSRSRTTSRATRTFEKSLAQSGLTIDRLRDQLRRSQTLQRVVGREVNRRRSTCRTTPSGSSTSARRTRGGSRRRRTSPRSSSRTATTPPAAARPREAGLGPPQGRREVRDRRQGLLRRRHEGAGAATSASVARGELDGSDIDKAVFSLPVGAVSDPIRHEVRLAPRQGPRQDPGLLQAVHRT
jgi:hypothetical protein